LFGGMLLSFVLTTVVIYVPAISSLFGFERIEPIEYVIAIGLALSVIPIVECVKFFQRIATRKKAQ
jgi:Ca2+-transporting ATPase